METFAFLQSAAMYDTSWSVVPHSSKGTWQSWPSHTLKISSHSLTSILARVICLTGMLSISSGMMSPALSGILQPGQTLVFGDNGPQVIQLQEELRTQGFYPGVATGNYLQQTTDAVSRYQRSVGLTADGIFGAATDAALFDGIFSFTASQSVTSTASSVGNRTYRLGDRVLRRGNRGQDVRELQTLMNDRFAPISIDGVFGQETEDFVIGFQELNGLRADGLVGNNTLSALRNRPFGQVPESELPPAVISPRSRDSSTTFPSIRTFGTFESRRASDNAQQINVGRYQVIIPTNPDNVEKLASTRVVVPSACLVRSRRGSYIFAGGYSTHGEAESVRLALRSRRIRRNDTNAPRLDARVNYKRGDFRDLECFR